MCQPQLLQASDVIGYLSYPLLSRAVGTTVERSLGLYTVANDLALAVLAHRGELVNCTLKAVERMGVAGSDDLEGQIVIVAADLTSSHGTLLCRAARCHPPGKSDVSTGRLPALSSSCSKALENLKDCSQHPAVVHDKRVPGGDGDG